MPGKRSYFSAVPGCLTTQQLRRQARDLAFLPPPPPPPPSAPWKLRRRFPAWADFPERDDSSDFAATTCEQETQCDPIALSFGQANPPSSGQFLDTINQALKIIELQCQRPDLPPSSPIGNSVAPWTISLESLVPTPSSVAPPHGEDKMFGEPCAEWHTLEARPSETSCFGEDEILKHNDGINALPEHFNIAADDAEGPFTPAQNIVLDREINATVMKILDPLIDMIIAKVVALIETNVKTAIDPICHDFSCRLDALQGELTAIAAEEEEGPNSAAQYNLYNDFRLIVQTSMKRYCFKRTQGDHNPMQIDQLHVENGSELVRYFEKLVRDEISTSNSAPDLSDPNLMHSDQFDTGVTLHECTDFDEPMNDFHSTAACAQLLQYSLSGSQEPTP